MREVLAWVEAGEADCGVVYATDAKTSDAVQVVSSAPADGPQVLYPAAIIKDCANPEGAQAFWISSPVKKREKYLLLMALHF